MIRNHGSWAVAWRTAAKSNGGSGSTSARLEMDMALAPNRQASQIGNGSPSSSKFRCPAQRGEIIDDAILLLLGGAYMNSKLVLCVLARWVHVMTDDRLTYHTFRFLGATGAWYTVTGQDLARII